MTDDVRSTRNESGEWQYAEGDVIEEEHEPHAPGGMPIGKSNYRIKRRLREEPSGKRFYHVDKVEGGTHLYTADAIEGRFLVVNKDWEGLKR